MNISYEKLNHSHLDQILEMTQKEFSTSYEQNKSYWEKRFEEILNENDAHSQGVFDRDDLIGFLLAFRMSSFPKTKEIFEIYLNDSNYGKLLVPKPNIKETDYGLDNLIVDSNYRRRGIGNRLVDNFLRELPDESSVFLYTQNSGPMTKCYVDNFDFIKILDCVKEGVETGSGIYVRN